MSEPTEPADPGQEPPQEAPRTLGGVSGILAGALVKALWPKLEPLIKSQLEKYGPVLVDMIQRELAEWLPKILKTVIVGSATAAGHLLADTEDKVTDAIPTQLDDKLDPIVRDTMDKLGQMFGGVFDQFR